MESSIFLPFIHALKVGRTVAAGAHASTAHSASNKECCYSYTDSYAELLTCDIHKKIISFSLI